MHRIELGGMTLPVIGIVPLVEINMMSDERWQQLAEESAMEHYRKWYGRAPESVQEALRAQRKFIERLECEEKGQVETLEIDRSLDVLH